MAKTNWKLTDTVKPEDMNSLGQEINDLQQNTKLASLTKPGIVQLSSATNSTAEDRAATPKAVKTAEDNAKAYTDSKLDRVDLTTTLGPGTSVINVDQASGAEFRVYGNTLVNLLGSYGNFEVDSNGDGLADGWDKTSGRETSLAAEKVLYGLKAQRVIANTADTTMIRYVRRYGIPLMAGKRYVAIADLITDGTTPGEIRMYATGYTGGDFIGTSGDVTADRPIFVKFTLSSDTADGGLFLYNRAALGSTGWVQFDGAGIYEVSEELYNRIGIDITVDNIRDYLPHVDGVQHVKGVSIYHPSKNLLPSQPDTLHANAKLTAPYELVLNATEKYQGSRIVVDVKPNTVYTISAEMTASTVSPDKGYFDIYAIDRSGNSTWLAELASFNQSRKFTTPATCVSLRIAITSTTAGTFTFKNWQLELGDKATPFEPAKPQQLIIPETLVEVGGYRDEVMVSNDGATLVKRVQRDVIVADGSLTWYYHTKSNSTYALINSKAFNPVNWEVRTGRGIKYNGVQLLNMAKGLSWGDIARVDVFELSPSSIYFTINRSEVGWTESIEPNGNAMKAAMNGWKATNNNGSKYTSWVSILDGNPPVTNTESYVAANKAPGWTAWATIDYALAEPEIKQIKTDGAISLHPGGNQLTVEAGIVQREKVKLHLTGGLYYINGTAATKPSKRPARLLQVYKGADPDDAWILRVRNNPYELGLGYAFAEERYIDPNADYYVTYLPQDKYDYSSNVTQLDVSYKAGISATLSDMVSSSAELKAENDRQDFADTYIQAFSENNRKDLDSLVQSKGKPNGIAGLDASGKVPSAQLNLPSNLETTTGAQNKADAALASAKAYSDLRTPDATTTRKGVVQLNDAINSTSTTLAATANAVKKVADSVAASKSQLDTYTSDPSGKPIGYMWLRTDL